MKIIKEGQAQQRFRQKEGEEGQIALWLLQLGEAVSSNLLWAGRIAKEQ